MSQGHEEHKPYDDSIVGLVFLDGGDDDALQAVPWLICEDRKKQDE